MTSSRPYIVRALYEWILDNNCTPYILVDANGEGVEVPRQYVKNGQIVLNIAPVAVMDLVMDSDQLHFNGRFGGVPMDICVPMYAVMGIYARENGQGMLFDPEEPPPGGGPGPAKPEKSASAEDKRERPSLKVVK